MKKRYVVLILLCPLLFWSAWIVLMLDPFPNTVPLAIYRNMTAQIIDDRVTQITVENGLAKEAERPSIYVRISPERVVNFVDLTMNDADQLPVDRHDGIDVKQRKYVYYDRGFTILEFDGESLKGATISSGTRIFLSARREGPFFTLPISKEMLIKEFGQPERWGRGSTLGF